jgi:hypothetical protein
MKTEQQVFKAKLKVFTDQMDKSTKSDIRKHIRDGCSNDEVLENARIRTLTKEEFLAEFLGE